MGLLSFAISTRSTAGGPSRKRALRKRLDAVSQRSAAGRGFIASERLKPLDDFLRRPRLPCVGRGSIAFERLKPVMIYSPGSLYFRRKRLYRV